MHHTLISSHSSALSARVTLPAIIAAFGRVGLCGFASLVTSLCFGTSHLVITRYLGHRLQRLAARSQ
jgi:hypothetical protein